MGDPCQLGLAGERPRSEGRRSMGAPSPDLRAWRKPGDLRRSTLTDLKQDRTQSVAAGGLLKVRSRSLESLAHDAAFVQATCGGSLFFRHRNGLHVAAVCAFVNRCSGNQGPLICTVSRVILSYRPVLGERY